MVSRRKLWGNCKTWNCNFMKYLTLDTKKFLNLCLQKTLGFCFWNSARFILKKSSIFITTTSATSVCSENSDIVIKLVYHWNDIQWCVSYRQPMPCHGITAYFDAHLAHLEPIQVSSFMWTKTTSLHIRCHGSTWRFESAPLQRAYYDRRAVCP